MNDTKRMTMAEVEEMIVQINNDGQGLSRWEREFMEDMTKQWDRHKRMSLKQEQWMAKIFEQRVKRTCSNTSA